MGTLTDVVYDVEQDMEPVSPAEELAGVIGQLMDADRWLASGQGYALGRLYTEISVLVREGDSASDQDTALAFAVLYQRMMLEFRDRKRTAVLSLEQAWAGFCRSLGGSLDA